MAGCRIAARVGGFATEPVSGASVDDLFLFAVQIGEHVGLGADILVVFPDGEMPVAQGFLAGFQRTALGLPLGNAAVKNGHFMGTEYGQHPPCARGAFQRAVIIEDDAAAIAQAQRLHAAGEFFGGLRYSMLYSLSFYGLAAVLMALAARPLRSEWIAED